MNPDRRPLLKLSQSATCVVVGLLAALAGQQAFWTDSEMWSTVSVRHLFTATPYYDFRIKPLFELWLWLGYQIAAALNVHPMSVARVLSASAALFGIFMFHRYARRLGGGQIAAGLTLALLGNSFIIKRFFSVRSDELVSVIYLALLCLGPGPLTYVLLFSSLLITPKAILWILAYIVAFRIEFARPTRGMAALAVAGVGLTVWFAQGRALPFLWDSFENFFLFEHVVRLLGENPLLVPLWIHNVYYGLFHRDALDSSRRASFDFANFLLGGMLAFPDRLPFFLAALTPFWLLPIAASPLRERLCARPLAPVLRLYFIVSSLFWSGFLFWQHGSSTQRHYSAWLTSQDLSGLQIYDPVGVLPFSPNAENWWVGPAERGNRAVLETLRHQRPDLIIFTGRLSLLGSDLQDLIEQHYWTDGRGLFFRQLNLPALPEGDVSSLRLKLAAEFPRWLKFPERAYQFRLLGPARLDLSQYASWLMTDGQREPFGSGRLNLKDLERRRLLLPPKGAERLVVYPIELQTPYDRKWSEIFRFDPEI